VENVLLDGGLDLVHARPAVLPGRLRECLNYEVGWARGYTRIDGFERFDGKIDDSVLDYAIVKVWDGGVSNPYPYPLPPVGSEVWWYYAQGALVNWDNHVGTLIAAERGPAEGDDGEPTYLTVAPDPSLEGIPDGATIIAGPSGAPVLFSADYNSEDSPPSSWTMYPLRSSTGVLTTYSSYNPEGLEFYPGDLAWFYPGGWRAVPNWDNFMGVVTSVEGDGSELSPWYVTIALDPSFDGVLPNGSNLTAGPDGGPISHQTFFTEYDEPFSSWVVTAPLPAGSQAEYLADLRAQADTFRDTIGPAPGGGTILGLHFHEDALHAIRDVLKISLAPDTNNILQVGMYVYTLNPLRVGEVIAADAEANEYHIASVDKEGFSLEAGDSVDVALSVRFVDGSGGYSRGQLVDLPAHASDTSGWMAVLDHRDGSFDSGNALGVIVIAGPDAVGPAPATAMEVHAGETTGTALAGTFTTGAVVFAGQASFSTVSEVFTTADHAALWRSTPTGWKAATTGKSVPFTAGAVNPFSETPVPSTVTRLPRGVYKASGAGIPNWSSPITNILLDDGDTTGVFVGGAPSVPVEGRSNSLAVHDYGFGLFDDAVVTGIEVNVRGRDTEVGGVKSLRIGAINSSHTSPMHLAEGVTIEDNIIGGATKLWARGGHTPAELNASGWGFKIWATAWNTMGAVVDTVEVTVHYTSLPTGEVFLWDGTNDIGTLSLAAAVVNAGEWGVDDGAVGYFRLKDWDIVAIPLGTEIYTKAGGPDTVGNLLVATTDGNVTAPLLPGSTALELNKSRYEMMSFNFYASEDRNAIYGVSGAGPAFWYDGTTLDFVLTGVAVDKDKPRHIAPHVSRLALGYIWGEVYVSEPGEPLQYNGTLFAATFGFGDKITGLTPIASDALAVFTESSSHALVGVLTATAQPEQKVISPKVGAIEYTVQNTGTRPIFASFRGIETLETMDQYSDFFTAPLTYDVSTWLLPRLQGHTDVIDGGVVASVVVRNKNQFRMFFADGYVMTLTYVGPDKTPQSTIQRYWVDNGAEADDTVYTVFATAAGVTSGGRDRVFFSVLPEGSKGQYGYAYEMDLGRSFDGAPIQAHIELSHYYSKDPQSGAPAPYMNKTFNVVHMHGRVNGYSELRLSRSVNYEEIDEPDLNHELMTLGALTEPADNTVRDKYTKGRLTASGFAVSVRVESRTAVEFPHTLQMITFLDDSARKPNR